RTHQRLEVDEVADPAEPEPGTAVFVALTQHPLGHAAVDEQAHAPALEDAGPVRRLDLLAGAGVDDHRFDAGHVEQVGEHQAGRPAADDADLGPGDRHREAVPSVRGTPTSSWRS